MNFFFFYRIMIVISYSLKYIYSFYYYTVFTVFLCKTWVTDITHDISGQTRHFHLTETLFCRELLCVDLFNCLLERGDRINIYLTYFVKWKVRVRHQRVHNWKYLSLYQLVKIAFVSVSVPPSSLALVVRRNSCDQHWYHSPKSGYKFRCLKTQPLQSNRFGVTARHSMIHSWSQSTPDYRLQTFRAARTPAGTHRDTWQRDESVPWWNTGARWPHSKQSRSRT